jgi:ABC-2 type transport system permease protein
MDRLSALAAMRWQMFRHSIQTVRGRLELVSRILVGLLFTLLAVGGSIGYGAAAWYFISRGHAEYLAFLLWPILLFWQIFPVMASAFSESPDSSYLLRFPLSYRSYFLIRIFYGLLDPASFVGGFWLLGMTVAVGVAAPALLPWAAVVLLVFGMFNVLLTQMIFIWVEKWLVQRRTREIIGVLFFLLFMSIQFIGPLANHYGHGARIEVARIAGRVSTSQQFFPPGASANAIAKMKYLQWPPSLASFLLLSGYTAVVFWLLSIRFRAQYRGENLSETGGHEKSKAAKQPPRAGWSVLGAPGAIAATFEKEIRYLARSGPLLFSLAVPLIMLVFFRVQRTGNHAGFFARSPSLVFPIGAAYALLLLTNLSYNTFGGDTGGGVQFFFAAPVRLRDVLIAKNLAHTFVFAVDVLVIWLGVWLLYQRPLISVTLLTLVAALFVLPVDFVAGNVLSIYSPKKANPGKFRQQRAAQITVLASFALRAVLLGLVALVVWMCRRYGSPWLAGPILLSLAVCAFAGYAGLLGRTENLALERREVLITELGRK